MYGSKRHPMNSGPLEDYWSFQLMHTPEQKSGLQRYIKKWIPFHFPSGVGELNQTRGIEIYSPILVGQLNILLAG